MARLKLTHLIVLSATLGLAGCDTISSLNPFDTTSRYKQELLPEVAPDTLYNQGLARLQSGDTAGAAKAFSDIDRQAAFSPQAKRGLIMTAFAHYEGKRYDEAITAARRFLTLHPGDKDAAYAQYLLAMSNYNQIPDIGRDQERTERALVALQELIDRYPKSEYVLDAREKILFAKDQLAGKEMNVGRFYLKQRNFPAAINRFRDVVSKYQTTRHVEEALMRLTEAYLALGVTNEAQTAAAVLGHNFPESPWYRDAYSLLQSGGLEPREQAGSWISRAFQGFTRVVGLAR
ncbi:MAG: outer membrane protein assembly factor BamD [Beijerinckiaceae bacterium]|jgi:outer membrane protein assembly factor BamD|nr:outer membrane protein assembly factor BamD [Beijerinckiaceae bacterium]